MWTKFGKGLFDALKVKGPLTHVGSAFGVFGASSAQLDALTADAGEVTYTVTDTPDYELQTGINSSAYGFATLGEFEGFVAQFIAMQTQLGELRALVEAYGLTAASE